MVIGKHVNTQAKKNITGFLLQFQKYFVIKVRFSGKGYKIKKNTKNSIILLFNRAHTTILWWRNLILKKQKKYKLCIKCNSYTQNVVRVLLQVRYVNIFTKRGLRIARQALLKKKGKK